MSNMSCVSFSYLSLLKKKQIIISANMDIRAPPPQKKSNGIFKRTVLFHDTAFYFNYVHYLTMSVVFINFYFHYFFFKYFLSSQYT